MQAINSYYFVLSISILDTATEHCNHVQQQYSREAKFIMDGISKKLIKDGIHSTIRVNFPRISEFLATTLLVISRSADFVSC